MTTYQKELFFEKRKQLMIQTFFENEYAKRHFLINANFTEYNNAIPILLEEIIYASDYEPCEKTIEKILLLQKMTTLTLSVLFEKVKNNLPKNTSESIYFDFLIGDDDLLSAIIKDFISTNGNENTFITVEILRSNILSHRAYGIPFYNLIMPTHMINTYRKIKNDKFEFKPVIKQIYATGKTLQNLLYRTIFSYCETEVNGFELLDFEKEYLKIMIDNVAPQKISTLDIQNAMIVMKCSNGADLTEEEFGFLICMINEYLSKDFKSAMHKAVISRAIGLLFYDFCLAATAKSDFIKLESFGNQPDDFMKFLKKDFGEEYKNKNSSKNIHSQKKTLREARNLASICIMNNKLLSSTKETTGKFHKPPEIKLPEHIFDYFFDFFSNRDEIRSQLRNIISFFNLPKF